MISTFQIAYKNLCEKGPHLLTLGGLMLSSWVLVSLLGFNRGYESALNRDIDNMGYQVMVMAKGCPYEAATLMLQGGTGLRYIEQSSWSIRSRTNRKWRRSRRSSCRPISTPTRVKAAASPGISAWRPPPFPP